MVVLDVNKYRTARRLAASFSSQIGKMSSKQRDRDWYTLLESVQALGFPNVDSIYAPGRDMFREELVFQIVDNVQAIDIGAKVVSGQKPSTVFIVFCKHPFVVMSAGCTPDMLGDTTGVTVWRSPRSNDMEPRFMCYDRGTLSFQGVLNASILTRGFSYANYQELFRRVIQQLNIGSITEANNDIFTAGEKICGNRVSYDRDRGLFYFGTIFSFDLDRERFAHCFKDSAFYNRLPRTRLHRTEEQTLQAICDQWEIMYGFPPKIEDLR